MEQDSLAALAAHKPTRATANTRRLSSSGDGGAILSGTPMPSNSNLKSMELPMPLLNEVRGEHASRFTG
jgi:hypothetical protein